MYTGEVQREAEDTVMVVYAADKYELKGLLEIWFLMFKEEIEDYKIVDMIILSERHNLKDFKDLAMKRIMKNKSKFISDTVESHPQLLFDLFKS